ncbi:winged helix-turn helix [Klebsiella sp. OBRC7]|nr:winged helix-turn helix [Klebsiella sp. OBRC7]
MKLTHFVDRQLTTQMAAQRLDIFARQCRRLLSRYRESGPPGMANRRRGNPSNNQLPDGFAQYALNIIRDRYTDFGRCWRVKSLQNCTMSTCRKKLSGRLWLKPVSGSPSNNVRRKFSSHVIVLPVVVS